MRAILAARRRGESVGVEARPHLARRRAAGKGVSSMCEKPLDVRRRSGEQLAAEGERPCLLEALRAASAARGDPAAPVEPQVVWGDEGRALHGVVDRRLEHVRQPPRAPVFGALEDDLDALLVHGAERAVRVQQPEALEVVGDGRERLARRGRCGRRGRRGLDSRRPAEPPTPQPPAEARRGGGHGEEGSQQPGRQRQGLREGRVHPLPTTSRPRAQQVLVDGSGEPGEDRRGRNAAPQGQQPGRVSEQAAGVSRARRRDGVGDALGGPLSFSLLLLLT